ncbi:MAG: hypothetical protein ACRD6X_04475, partial [Pyrinomonadaceae bacterium]
MAEGVKMETQEINAIGSNAMLRPDPNSVASSVLRNIFGRNGLAQADSVTVLPESSDNPNALDKLNSSGRVDASEMTPQVRGASPSDLVRDVLSRVDARKERAATELGMGADEVESLP